MIDSTAAQPTSMATSHTRTTMRTPFAPRTLRSAVYCSRPHLPDGAQVARAMSATEMTLPITAAAIPVRRSTKVERVPPIRKAQVAMARPMLTQVKSPKPQTRSSGSTGRMPNCASRAATALPALIRARAVRGGW